MFSFRRDDRSKFGTNGVELGRWKCSTYKCRTRN